MLAKVAGILLALVGVVELVVNRDVNAIVPILTGVAFFGLAKEQECNKKQ